MFEYANDELIKYAVLYINLHFHFFVILVSVVFTINQSINQIIPNIFGGNKMLYKIKLIMYEQTFRI